jgi:hypothetical protein
VPLVGREFVQWRALVQRHFDDDVQRTEVALDRGDAGGDRIGVGDIEMARPRRCAGPRRRGASPAAAASIGAIAPLDDDARAGGGATACRSRARARCRPR